MVKRTVRRHRARGGDDPAPAAEEGWFSKLKSRVLGTAPSAGRRRGTRMSRRRRGGVEPTAPPASLTGPGVPAAPSTTAPAPKGTPGSSTAWWAPSRGGRKSRRRGGMQPAFGTPPASGTSPAFPGLGGPAPLAPLGSPGVSSTEPLAPLGQAEAPKKSGRRSRRGSRKSRKH
jgi:hypothetical protein